MPTYDICCPEHGVREVFTRRMVEGPLPCDLCDRASPKVPVVPNLAYSAFETPGPKSSGEFTSKQFLGQKFKSRKAFDDELKKRGMSPLNAWDDKKFREGVREEADLAAQKAGYNDADEFRYTAKNDPKAHKKTLAKTGASYKAETPDFITPLGTSPK